MLDIPMQTQNNFSSGNVGHLNNPNTMDAHPSPMSQRQINLENICMPGELFDLSSVQDMTVSFGWKCDLANVDIDVAAFMLTHDEIVPDESYCVFYRQHQTPDKSLKLIPRNAEDRYCFRLVPPLVNPVISTVAFVCIINEATRNNLNFSVVNDVYMRIINNATRQVICGTVKEAFTTDDVSVLVGFILNDNGIFQFSPCMQGVNFDFRTVCESYGITVDD